MAISLARRGGTPWLAAVGLFGVLLGWAATAGRADDLRISAAQKLPGRSSSFTWIP